MKLEPKQISESDRNTIDRYVETRGSFLLAPEYYLTVALHHIIYLEEQLKLRNELYNEYRDIAAKERGEAHQKLLVEIAAHETTKQVSKGHARQCAILRQQLEEQETVHKDVKTSGEKLTELLREAGLTPYFHKPDCPYISDPSKCNCRKL